MPKVDVKKFVAEKTARLRKMKMPKFKKPKVYIRWLSLLFRGSWVKVAAVVVTVFLVLYYSLGGWLVQNIDTTTDYEIRTTDNQSATVEMMSFLINREIRENMWTPNLPFIFPSYFLDNMPNFQLGVVSSLKTTSAALAARLDKTVAQKSDMPLKSAAEYLSYPGTVWMFSPANKLVPAPSACIMLQYSGSPPNISGIILQNAFGKIPLSMFLMALCTSSFDALTPRIMYR